MSHRKRLEHFHTTSLEGEGMEDQLVCTRDPTRDGWKKRKKEKRKKRGKRGKGRKRDQRGKERWITLGKVWWRRRGESFSMT